MKGKAKRLARPFPTAWRGEGGSAVGLPKEVVGMAAFYKFYYNDRFLSTSRGS